MKRLFILLSFLFFSSLQSISQRTEVEEYMPFQLPRNLSIKDKDFLKKLNDTAYDIRYTDPTFSMKYALFVDSVATIGDNKKEKANAQIILGIHAKTKGDYLRGIKYFENALELRHQIKDHQGVASCYNNIGNIYLDAGDVKLAETAFLKGIAFLQKHDINKGIKAIIYSNLSMVYLQKGKNETAARYIDLSIKLRLKLKDTTGYANSLLNAGNLYQSMSWWGKAKESYDQSLQIFKEEKDLNGIVKCQINMGALNYYMENDSLALGYYHYVFSSKAAIGKYELGVAHKNVGTIYQRLNQSNESLKHYNKSLEYFKDLGSMIEKADVYYNIALLYFKDENYNESVVFLQKSQKLFDDQKAPALAARVFFKLSENYAKLDQFEKAFFYSNESIVLQDRLDESDKEAMGYKEVYNMHEHQEALKTEKKQKQKMKFYGLLIILSTLILTVCIWLRARYKRRRIENEAHAKAEKNRIKVKKEIDDLLKEQEIKTLQAKLEGQDTERVRIGQDLHDRLGVMLSTIKLYFQSLEEKINNSQSTKYDQFQKATVLLDNACDEVRKIAHDMQSSTLKHFGLKEELKELAETLKQSNKIDVKVVTFGINERLDQQMEFKIYKIIQELVGNALKHSKASELNIQVNRFEGLINIIVEDNGVGFKPKLPIYEEGLGLKNIKTRIHHLQGNMNIDSDIGRGTSISIDIPQYLKQDQYDKDKRTLG